MKRILLLLLIIFVFFVANANADLYTCVDRKGNPIITSSPNSEMKDCKLKDSSGDSESYATSASSGNMTIKQVDQLLKDLDRKSKQRKWHVNHWDEPGLTTEERRQQTDLLELRARLAAGDTSSHDDRSIKRKRQLEDMEEARQRQNAEISRERQRNKEYPYESSTGQRYEYDLSNPADRARYRVDPAAQARDRVNPRVKLDRNIGQYGGGAD